MKDILKDEKLRKLLKVKQKYELLSWVIPLVSILSLIIILFLTSKNHLTELTIIVLVLLITFIVLGYLFDHKLTEKIHNAYARLNQYFQDEIVPQLLVKDNESIVFDSQYNITADVIDEVEIFNNYREYKTQYSYAGKLEKFNYRFSEVLFDNLVDFETKGMKEVNEELNLDTNYHWYTITLNNTYPTEALYLLGTFVNFNQGLLKKFKYFNFSKYRLHPENNIELYLVDLEKYEPFISKEIIRVLNSLPIDNTSVAIYLSDNNLHIILEEFDNLIHLTRSNKIVVENLLQDYYKEQALVRKIAYAFEKDV